MPRSGYSQQQCACKQHARTAVTIVVSRLRTQPRERAKTRTLYFCNGCLANWTKATARAARASLLNAVGRAAGELKPVRGNGW